MRDKGKKRSYFPLYALTNFKMIMEKKKDKKIVANPNCLTINKDKLPGTGIFVGPSPALQASASSFSQHTKARSLLVKDNRYIVK